MGQIWRGVITMISHEPKSSFHIVIKKYEDAIQKNCTNKKKTEKWEEKLEWYKRKKQRQ